MTGPRGLEYGLRCVDCVAISLAESLLSDRCFLAKGEARSSIMLMPTPVASGEANEEGFRYFPKHRACLLLAVVSAYEFSFYSHGFSSVMDVYIYSHPCARVNIVCAIVQFLSLSLYCVTVSVCVCVCV